MSTPDSLPARLLSGCPECGAMDWGIGTATTATGATIHPYYCKQCGKNSRQYASKKVAADAADGTTFRLKSEGTRTCAVCGSLGAEEHHWAPRFLFGSECERWPTSMLCVPCHLRWHETVTPGMNGGAK